ncbi:MAG: TolC family protein [Bacteroidetes bacterium]|nr:TolC family protein [Bacteroidota bacterium]
MKTKNNFKVFIYSMVFLVASCNLPKLNLRKSNGKLPAKYSVASDTLNSAQVNWKNYFNDAFLIALIDTALVNNQELNIIKQEVNLVGNDVRLRKAAYLPFVGIGLGAGTEKVGLYTSQGAADRSNQIAPNQAFPDPLSNLYGGLSASWEVDIWKKLRNYKKAAFNNYLATIEGKNFATTNLVAEIANAYYELLALDNQLLLLKKNLEVQKNALETVKLEKAAAKVTELAVKKFEAEVLKNQSHQYEIQQSIVETENKINFLVGRFPQPVSRQAELFLDLKMDTVYAGVPSQLLNNRTDVKQAQRLVESANLNVKAVKAEFYPALTIRSGIGYNAFNTKHLLQTPQSLAFNVAGDLIAPLINRNAIKAEYFNAGVRQQQSVFKFEQTLLNAHVEVTNLLWAMVNLKTSFDLKQKEVTVLNESYDISTVLFKSARADYMEVLLTQRDALEARFDLVETKKQQMHARVNLYRALGGGWN